MDMASLRWDAERAQRWRAEHPWEVGANFSPSTASNQLEMWQADTFDLPTIDRELGFAAGCGMSVMRVFLHDLVYNEDPEGFLSRIEQYLEVAAKHKIATMFVLFDGCWCPEGCLGKQPEPLPKIHNPCWLQSPLLRELRDVDRWGERLKPYAQGVIGRFRSDSRVHSWDLYNEVDNWQLERLMAWRRGTACSTHEDWNLRHELLCSVFRWAREVNPDQPLTACEWEIISDRFRKVCQENSDIGTFHRYANARATEKEILRMRAAYPGRPLLITEYLGRQMGSTFEANLALLKKHDVGAINWGLVQGKTQSHWPWWTWLAAWQRLCACCSDEHPSVWFHDVFWQDGSPFSQSEVDLIRKLTKLG